VVPHLHWHIVARFAWDSHFPAPVWASAKREVTPGDLAAVEALLPALDEAIAAHLAFGPGNHTPS
jgi:diadenosine tetraphosphate (Ap4A) HIT family hydrolase